MWSAPAVCGVLMMAAYAWHYLLRLGLVPRVLCQVWFGLCVVGGLLFAVAVGSVAHFLAARMPGRVSRATAEWASGAATSIGMRVACALNPQVRLSVDTTAVQRSNLLRDILQRQSAVSRKIFSETGELLRGQDPAGAFQPVAKQLEEWRNPNFRLISGALALGHMELSVMPTNAVVLVNHQSYWDSLQFAALVTPSRFGHLRTMMMHRMSKVPIIGRLFFDLLGNFPVYYNGTKVDDFSLDRERQQRVTAAVDNYLEYAQGDFILTPEGAINPTPERILPPRFGALRQILEARARAVKAGREPMPMVVVTYWGNQYSWPRGARMGGASSDIYMRVVPFEMPSHLPVEPDTGAPRIADASEALRAFMQSEVDLVRSKYEAAVGRLQ
jgi:1-acyl-sn-glycerol-3-phosphate acyltransferase